MGLRLRGGWELGARHAPPDRDPTHGATQEAPLVAQQLNTPLLPLSPAPLQEAGALQTRENNEQGLCRIDVQTLARLAAAASKPPHCSATSPTPLC